MVSQFGHILTLTIWLAVSGCVAPLPLSSETPKDYERVAIDLTIQAWVREGLPWSDRCDEELTKIQIVVSHPEEFTRLCNRRPLGAGGNLYACNSEQNEHIFPFWLLDGSKIPLLVINALQPEDRQRMLVIHETLHWLERCSGKGIDFKHADERVWLYVKGRAQYRYTEYLTPASPPVLYSSASGSPLDSDLTPIPYQTTERNDHTHDTGEILPPASVAAPGVYTPDELQSHP